MKNLASVAIAMQTGTPVLLWGAPGCGKTQNLYAMAKHMGRHMEVLIASTREPSDFSGLPIPRRNANEVLDAMRAMADMMKAGCSHRVPKGGRPISELKELYVILGFDIKALGLDQREDL